MNDVITGLFNENKSSRKPNNDEYEKDGIIFCKACDTAREAMVTNPFTGKLEKVRCICNCQKLERDAENERLRVMENQRRAEKARRRCFGDMGYSDYTFTKDDGKDAQNSRRMRNYSEHFAEFYDKGQGLILFGGTGTGKSFHSACVANALMDRGYSVLMVSVPSLVSKIQRNAFGDYDPLAEAIKCDLLILDDLGAERGTEYAREQVYSVVDGRYSKNRPMIVSTNLTPQQMTTSDDITLQRIYSRIIERCFPLKYNGADRRLNGTGRAEMSAILDM